MAKALKEHSTPGSARQIAELGAGDGHFLLTVAKRVNGSWPDSEAILVDRLKVHDSLVGNQFHRMGWRVREEIAEVTEWLRQPGPVEVLISNLFFHQFENEQLAEMFRLAASKSQLVIALEPGRGWMSKLCGRLLWVIGCNRVTRHDANISIRAGFAGHELSALWPDKQNWQLTERRAGMFSHLFVARRKN